MYFILEWWIFDGFFIKFCELFVSYIIFDIGGVLSNMIILVGGWNIFFIDNFISYDLEINVGG